MSTYFCHIELFYLPNSSMHAFVSNAMHGHSSLTSKQMQDLYLNKDSRTFIAMKKLKGVLQGVT